MGKGDIKDIVEALIKAGADVNGSQADGATKVKRLRAYNRSLVRQSIAVLSCQRSG